MDPDRERVPEPESPRMPRWPWIVAGLMCGTGLFLGALVNEKCAWFFVLAAAALSAGMWVWSSALGVDQHGARWVFGRVSELEEMFTGECDRSFMPRMAAMGVTIVSLALIGLVIQSHPNMLSGLGSHPAGVRLSPRSAGDGVHDVLLK